MRLDRRELLAGPHQVARRAGAEQQADGLDEDRLAGAGLARQHGEAGVELDLEPLDDGEMLDAQIAQHGGSRETGGVWRRDAEETPQSHL